MFKNCVLLHRLCFSFPKADDRWPPPITISFPIFWLDVDRWLVLQQAVQTWEPSELIVTKDPSTIWLWFFVWVLCGLDRAAAFWPQWYYTWLIFSVFSGGSDRIYHAKKQQNIFSCGMIFREIHELVFSCFSQQLWIMSELMMTSVSNGDSSRFGRNVNHSNTNNSALSRILYTIYYLYHHITSNVVLQLCSNTWTAVVWWCVFMYILSCGDCRE